MKSFLKRLHPFFYKQRFFSNSASVLRNFFKNLTSNAAKCCLIYLTIIILRSILYLAYHSHKKQKDTRKIHDRKHRPNRRFYLYNLSSENY